MLSMKGVVPSLKPAIAAAAVLAYNGPSAAAQDLLPDSICIADMLGEIAIDAETLPGRRLLRLSNATPNIGQGPLEIRGSTVVSDTRQEVIQRIYRADGTFWDRSAGTSSYHETHGHVHFDNWGLYRLRAATPSGGVGDLVVEGLKTSFCLMDMYIYDPDNPFLAANPAYGGCGPEVQGISPGWTDVYDRGLPDQWIDITGVADGRYWLEAQVDPDNKILEANETNNVCRIQIRIEPPPPLVPDRYEDNDTLEQVDELPEGGPASANLGLIRGRVEIESLSSEGGDDVDFFRFLLGRAPPAGSFVRIESPYLGSDLDLAVLNELGEWVGLSESYGNFEQVAIAGFAPGVYYIQVLAFSGDNPDYQLIFETGANQPPQIAVTAPATKVWIEQAFEAAPVSWSASDPEGEETSIALSIDRDRTKDKGTILVLGYGKLPGEPGVANVNTVGLGLGEWFVYAEASDGEATSGSWAPGSFVFYRKGDLNLDGSPDFADLRAARAALWRGKLPPGGQYILDMDRDRDVDWRDLILLERAVIRGRRP